MPQVQTYTHTVCVSTGQNKTKQIIPLAAINFRRSRRSRRRRPLADIQLIFTYFNYISSASDPPPSSANPKHKFNLQNVLRSFASPTPTLDPSARATLNPTAASAVYQSSGQRTRKAEEEEEHSQPAAKSRRAPPPLHLSSCWPGLCGSPSLPLSVGKSMRKFAN